MGRPVLDALSERPTQAPILHWWTGTAAETSRAVELGCYFSIHAQVARRSVFRSRVPIERILIETDHGQGDPVAAIPLRVGWAEHLVAQGYQLDVAEVRRVAWANLRDLVGRLGIAHLMPAGFTAR